MVHNIPAPRVYWYITAKYGRKAKKTRFFARLANQVLPCTPHVQPLLSFPSRFKDKLIDGRDYSAQEAFHLLFNMPLQERMSKRRT